LYIQAGDQRSGPDREAIATNLVFLSGSNFASATEHGVEGGQKAERKTISAATAIIQISA